MYSLISLTGRRVMWRLMIDGPFLGQAFDAGEIRNDIVAL